MIVYLIYYIINVLFKSVYAHNNCIKTKVFVN